MTTSKAPGFHSVVRILRAMPARDRELALYAANWWTDEYLDDAERNGDLPGRPNEMKPQSESLQ